MQKYLRLKIRSQKGSEENLMIYRGKRVKEKRSIEILDTEVWTSIALQIFNFYEEIQCNFDRI